MPLRSNLLAQDEALQACLIVDAAHVLLGAEGDHVRRIQIALAVLDGATIDSQEVHSKKYGPSTATAVLNYKTKRNIINFSYQTRPDNIVGKMTIKSLDDEMAAKEAGPSRLRWY
jgi:peptidoglycan hydrolase-like protein with peptidoglycan-binding domain